MVGWLVVTEKQRMLGICLRKESKKSNRKINVYIVQLSRNGVVGQRRLRMVNQEIAPREEI